MFGNVGNGFIPGLQLGRTEVFVMPGPYERVDTVRATLARLQDNWAPVADYGIGPGRWSPKLQAPDRWRIVKAIATGSPPSLIHPIGSARNGTKLRCAVLQQNSQLIYGTAATMLPPAALPKKPLNPAPYTSTPPHIQSS